MCLCALENRNISHRIAFTRAPGQRPHTGDPHKDVGTNGERIALILCPKERKLDALVVVRSSSLFAEIIF